MEGKRRRFGPLRAAVECGRDFCMETTIHGFIHVAAPGRWWGERVLWACATVAAILGAVEISMGQWQRYNESPTVVALEKDFRSWEFCMPGLTLCSQNKVDEIKLPVVIKKYWDVDELDEKYKRYERFVRDVANSSLLNLADLLNHEGEDLEVDLYQLVVDVLPEFNLKATWSMASQVPWFPVMSEVGACHATNSLAIPDDAIVKPSVNETKMFPITCKYSSLNCYLTIEIPETTTIYVHSPYDTLNVRAAPFDVRPGEERATELSVMESGCGRGVRGLPPRRRRCLYTDEPLKAGRKAGEERATELSVMESGCGRGVRGLPPRRRRCLYTDEPLKAGRKVYSTNSCRRACRNQEALRDCQCKPFYNHYEDGPACSLQGMRCLAARAVREAAHATSEAARVKSAKVAKRVKSASAITSDGNGGTNTANPGGESDPEAKADDCTCPLMCVDALFETLTLVTKPLGGPFGSNGVSRIKLQAPRTRYTREIVFYFQDLIVSFGGAAGLFLGASFISFVEILFFVSERLLGVLGLSTTPHQATPVWVKRIKASHEQTRIQHLNAVLEVHRLPSAVPEYWTTHDHA